MSFSMEENKKIFKDFVTANIIVLALAQQYILLYKALVHVYGM